MQEERVTEESKIIPYERRRLQTNDLRFDAPVAFEGPILESQPSLGAYWQIFLRRRWTIVSVVAIVTTLVAIASFKMEPVYRSTAAVEVDSETPQIQTLNDSNQQFPMDQDFLQPRLAHSGAA